MDALLLRLHRRVRASPFFYRLMLGTTILLACGFVPTGLVKLAGHRFTTGIPGGGDVIGNLFETLYRTGLWWRVIGAAQVAAGLLVLVPRLRAAGTVLFLAILANILAITVSLNFGNTEGLVAAMLLAVVFLLVWDYDRVRPLFGVPLAPVVHPVHALGGPVERGVYGAGLVGGMVVFLATRGFALPWTWTVPAALAVAAAAFVAAPLVALRAMPRPWFPRGSSTPD